MITCPALGPAATRFLSERPGSYPRSCCAHEEGEARAPGRCGGPLQGSPARAARDAAQASAAGGGDAAISAPGSSACPGGPRARHGVSGIRRCPRRGARGGARGRSRGPRATRAPSAPSRQASSLASVGGIGALGRDQVGPGPRRRAASHETGLGPALRSNPTPSRAPMAAPRARISPAPGRWRRGAGPTGSLAGSRPRPRRPQRLKKACHNSSPGSGLPARH